MSLGDEMLIQENDDDELSPAKITNVAPIVMEGECIVSTVVVNQHNYRQALTIS